ncbi:2-amino-4-hydroxy-6-hydroxymethyldihydropteridine diphosphokinase [Marinilabilia salmonicolor]|jgi:2-amino-4-hydroxy-6-hydroxymethyldihydropteridine diphosphokinase|uniref:2-amino-4-hydroxy-6- hydroxymethyldihydropteridine diphosphokinase n=1 Tax=Marinilabilia salmonicolor TaxID=989 RepID=UPI000D07A377|nr:2-amino-4-hydroxy-6-hydroxymethyldihydropteridine diphosphokinase [Marinilabilia salmonicolor]PRZ01661.1 2-amino-4-hydroxy-6-hydroxymethyldihydropteridine diphosphokinase [Marinilabilia salmonicolor]
MSNVILLLGGNRGNTENVFKQALALLEQRIGLVQRCSSLYKSPPWGFEDDQWFLNQVVFVETRLEPQAVLVETQQIERDMGRKKKTTTHYEGRLLDIDILFYDHIVISSPLLTVPHERLHLRRFTLLPLQELAPDFIHPGMNKSIATLLNECRDESEVIKL